MPLLQGKHVGQRHAQQAAQERAVHPRMGDHEHSGIVLSVLGGGKCLQSAPGPCRDILEAFPAGRAKSGDIGPPRLVLARIALLDLLHCQPVPLAQ